MSRFYSKLQEIEEALSFSNTFKAPDEDEQNKRIKEFFEVFRSKIKNKILLNDGTWRVKEDLFIDSSIKTLDGLNVSIVDGDFSCSYNNLSSLKGCPKIIKGFFNCERNDIKTLIDCPESVGGGFNCCSNNLTSLIGAPNIVNSNFSCSWNGLKSLEGCPKVIKGYFYCKQDEREKQFTKEDVLKVCNIRGSMIYV